MTGNEVKQLVTMLKLAFPRQAVSDETLRVYAHMLVDLRWDVAEPAVKRLLSTSRFFPTIAELREACAETSVGAPGDAAAWEAVNRKAWHRAKWTDCVACGESGYADIENDVVCPECKGTGRFDAEPLPPLHPLVKEAFDLCGGVVSLRETDNVNVWRAQFRDTYRELRALAVRAVQTGEQPALPPTERLALGTAPALEVERG